MDTIVRFKRKIMHPIAIAALSGFFFASWQLTSRAGTNTPMVLNLGMLVGAMVASLAYGVFAMKQSEWQSLASSSAWLPLLCGVLNGVGFIILLTAMQKSPSLTPVSITSMMTMIGLIALGSALFLGEPLNVDKLLGVGAAALAVYLLSK